MTVPNPNSTQDKEYHSKISLFRRKTKVLEKLCKVLHLSDPQQKFWWNISSGILAVLLEKCNYDENLQLKFLRLLHQILPTFGPGPSEGGKCNRWSPLSLDSTPMDFSWNYDGSNSIVRLAIDSYATPDDPFAQNATEKILHSIPEVDFQIFNAISEDIWIKPGSEAETRVLEHYSNPPYSGRLCHVLSALEFLKDGSITAKFYVTTRTAAYAKRTTVDTLTRNLIQMLDAKIFQATPLMPAYHVIDAYNEGLSKSEKQSVCLISWDCVKPLQSRVKLYLSSQKTSLKVIRDMWTQRGRLTGPVIDKGLECINELWPLLYCPPEDYRDEDELKNRDGRSQAVLMNLELKPGKALPVPKLYIQPSYFCGNDMYVAESLERWFDSKGWALGKTYVDDLKYAFSHLNMEKDIGAHTYVAIGVKESGNISVTMYLSPCIYASLSACS
ncbi:tryptophan dimethylallyltransferase-domain-containing protein [Pyronema omphalodes]|nr:tryptophan dimethylallyltransferase-domain-containing protein [Pyronema omphalodes]